MTLIIVEKQTWKGHIYHALEQNVFNHLIINNIGCNNKDITIMFMKMYIE